ncbi:hypothetical protein PHYBOEH_009351 [Phytophthora boehmeriae]|uniref:AraC effector-binding domain-containing protein n=1 Tax=Phytophthora boehmeriae TaxID=109152 RepID=A0A8T1VTX6_9STRA|nr:hypothetical protein PHYBOEH_009351 [Phytophthora boehmeriae]
MAAEATPTIKTLPGMRVLSLRSVLPNYRAQGGLWQQLSTFAKTHDVNVTGPAFAINYTKDCKQTDVEVEVCFPIADDAQVPQEAHFTVRDVPPVTRAATALHVGACDDLPSAYEKFFSWVKAEGLETNGPSREVYLKMPSGCDDPSSVTEIQQPIS